MPPVVGVTAYILRILLSIICWAPVTETVLDFEFADGCAAVVRFLVDLYSLVVLAGLLWAIFRGRGLYGRVKSEGSPLLAAYQLLAKVEAAAPSPSKKDD
eukprot:SAG22_NODE_2135_length_2957_cov_2.637859_2_plen_100_part_00